MSATTRNVQPVTASLGKEGSGELVSSRYAVRVGDVDVVMISDGVLPLPTSTMSTNVSEGDRNDWFDSRFLQRDMFDWALRRQPSLCSSTARTSCSSTRSCRWRRASRRA